MGSFVFWCLSQHGLKFNSWAMKTRLTSFSLLKAIFLAFFFFLVSGPLNSLHSPSVLLFRSNKRRSHENPKWGHSPDECAHACGEDLREAQEDGQPNLWAEIRYNGVKSLFPKMSKALPILERDYVSKKSVLEGKKFFTHHRFLGCWMVPSDTWASLGEEKWILLQSTLGETVNPNSKVKLLNPPRQCQQCLLRKNPQISREQCSSW